MTGMKKLFAGVLVSLGLLLFVYELGYYYFPVHTVILENRVLHLLGLAEKFELPKTSREQKSSVDFPTIDHFKMVGMDGPRKRFVLEGKRLEFKDLKIWMFYTPLVKVGVISTPKITFYAEEKGEIKCVSSRAKLLNKNQRLVFDKGAMCWYDEVLHKMDKVEYNHKEGHLKLTPPNKTPFFLR